jgi:uncharacterized protein YbjT (DUF2867 family)
MGKRPILVTRATGSQGGAVVRHLLRGDTRQVRAMTRRPSSDAAVRLKAQGAQIVQASLDHPPLLLKDCTGAHGVFLVQNFYEDGVGKGGEIRQGRHLVDAATMAGVKHYVQSTVASAGGAQAVQHIAAKQAVEALVRDAKIAHT